MIIPPERQGESNLILERIQKGSMVDTYETQRLRKDGSKVDVALTISPIRDEQGMVIGASKIARDINERKRSEQLRQETERELWESREQFRSFMNHAPILSWIVNAEGIIKYANPAWLNLIGRTEETGIGRSIMDMFPPEFSQEYFRNNQQVVETGKTLETMEQSPDLEGNVHTYLVSKFPVAQKEDGPWIGGIAIEITKLKQAEEDLRHMNLVMENAVEGIARLNTEGVYVSMNPSYAEISGYEVDQLLGQSWKVTVYGEDVPWLEESFQTIEQMGKLEAEVRGVKSGGLVFYKQVTLIGDYDTQGNLIGHYCFLKDISDRKKVEIALQKSEARYRNIIETTLEGIWILDSEGKTTFANEQMAKILGYTSEEMLGLSILDFFSHQDQEQAKVYLERRQQGIQERHTSKLLRKDGSSIWVMVSGNPQHDEDGNLIEIIGMITDITALVTTKEALRISKMQLSRVLDSSLDGIMAFRSVRDDRGNLIDFEWLLSNPTAAAIVKRQPEDLIGKRLLVEFPNNREEGWFDAYVEVVETDKPYQREFYCNHDGRECWFENIAVKLGDGLAVTFRNITAIKESEQAIQLVNQQLQERIADLDQRHEEMLILSEISDFMQASLTVEEACKALGTLVINLFPGCSGCLFITNASRN